MRFHQKSHQKSHHSLSSFGYPDSALDPIASQSDPFQGDFYLNGDLHANTLYLDTSVPNLSADNLTVDDLIVTNQISTLSVGDLTISSITGDGSGLNSVNAARLDGNLASAFQFISEKDQPFGYVGLDNGVVNSINSITGNITINGLTMTQYLNEFDLSSSVAPLIASGNSYSYELPDEFLPNDITELSSINGVDIGNYLVDGDNISLLTNDSGYLTSFTETDPIFTTWETNTEYLEWVTPAPSLSSDGGNAGDVAYDEDYLYIHVGTQWKRVALNSW